MFLIDPETLCDSEEHRHQQHFVGIPGIVGYIVGLPALSYKLLHKFRYKLHEPRTRIRLGFLYDGFRSEQYWYELVVALRKVLIIMISTVTAFLTK